MQLPPKEVVRQYELTYLVPASFTDAEVTAVREVVEQLVTKHQGKVLSTENWGKKQLAYKIKHLTQRHQDALYVHQVLEFNTKHVQAFEREVHLNEQVIRHLLVLHEESTPVADKPATKKPTAAKKVTKEVEKEVEVAAEAEETQVAE